MNWFVFAIAAWITFGLELALLPILDAGSGGVHPSMVIPLMAFAALYAPQKQALWAAIILGIIMDLLAPMPMTTGGSAIIVGPHALGYLLAAHFILAIRGALIRRNPLTLVIISIAASMIAQVVVIAIFTIRNMGTNPLIWDASAQLVDQSFSSLYTGLSALILSVAFFALAPTFGFHSSVPTRFARTIK
jgi:rod shape-determining protein MreD